MADLISEGPASMNSPSKFFARLAIGTLLFSSTVLADVAVTRTDAFDTDPWQPAFGGGTISVSPAFTEGGTTTAAPAGSGVVQSFKGDGKKLEAVGLFFSSTSAPALGKQFTISLIDYGTEGPVNKSGAQFNAVKTTVFADSFTWTTSATARQCYFDFTGASNVVLDGTHYYGIVVQFPEASGNNGIYRSSNDAYPDGRMMLGAIGAFNGSFAGGDRDANFAIYTVAPSAPAAAAAP
jgi:hypothetical protein